MSYNIKTLKLTEDGKDVRHLIPQELREDWIDNGYYPYELEDVLPVISRDTMLVLEVNGDYGHYVEIWTNGKKKKTIEAGKVLEEYIKKLKP